MRVSDVPIGDVVPYENNPRINDMAVDAVAESIKEFGFQQPIVCDADGTVIAGHTRLKAAKRLGLETVPVVRASELTPEQVNAYRLADNRTAELAEWDERALALELDGIGGIDMARFGFSDEDEEGQGETYTMATESPVYEPTGEVPEVADLYDHAKRDELVAAIDGADIDPELAEFLRSAAGRHTVFDYGKVAEYYAAAPAEVQRLFEDSCLVIVDFERAIELGYVRLDRRLDALLGEAGGEDD